MLDLIHRVESKQDEVLKEYNRASNKKLTSLDKLYDDINQQAINAYKSGKTQ